MIELLDDGLWAWRARHPEWHPGKWGAEVEILITIPYHVRSASAASARYGGARVWGHPACAKRLDDRSAFCELRTDRTPDGVSAYTIGKPRRYEMPLRLA